jgi:DNA-binding winged helix-turn-helix (wHTH) protein/tetratricopeptide (TPR) repeat protein
MQSTRKRRARFSSYEFDVPSGELTRWGSRLRLESQPAELLELLIEANGEMVSRSDLIAALWPGETEGEFDRRLDKAVAKLRASLNEDPAKPRFIETLKGRGYRFIAEVEIVNGKGYSPDRANRIEAQQGTTPHPRDHGNGPAKEAHEPKPGNSLAPGEEQEPGHSKPVETARSGFQSAVVRFVGYRWQWGLAAGLVLTAVLISAWAIHRSSVLSPTHKSIAILSLTNLSGNPADQWLSSALSDWLASDLTADGNLHAVSKENLARFRSEQGLKDFDQISPNVLAKLNRDLGPDLVLSGSYACSGIDDRSRIRLDVQLHDSRSGRVLYSVNVAGSRAEIFDLAASAGIQLRRKLQLGPRDASGLAAMRAMLPTNPDAARFYAEGTEEIERLDPADAQVLLQRAVALEPEHALSHAALSTADTMLGDSADARTEAKKSLDLATGLSTEQRLLVEGQFDETNYEWEKAVATYSRLFHLFPDSAENGIRLAHAQTLAGEPLIALDTIAQVRQSPLASDDEARVDLAEAEAAAGISDFRRERDAAARAAERAKESSATLLLARAEEDQGEALRALGNFSQALQTLTEAQTRYMSIGDRSAVARVLIDEGRVQWQQGNPAGAEASYNRAISLSQQTGNDITLGRAFTALAQFRMYYVSLAEGNRLCRRALAIFRRIGNKQEEAYTLSIMADILSPTDHAQAIKLYQQSLDLSREVNDRSRIAGRLMDLGIQATVQGNLSLADRYTQQSRAIYHQIGERNREALLLNLLSIVRTWQGRLDEAGDLSNQAVSTLDSIGEVVPMAQSRQNLAIVQMEEGRLSEAEASLRLAIQEHQDAHNLGGVVIASGQLAEVLLREKKLPESRAALGEYDRLGAIASDNRPLFGEHVTERMILSALTDAAEGKLRQARNEAAKAVNYALKTDQGSMLMKARLALGEVELESGSQAAGHRHLESLIADADQKGFGLISHEAGELLAH